MGQVIPDEIVSADDVGMVMDESFGVGLMRDYASFLRICEKGPQDEGETKILSVYIANIEHAPPAWERALRRHPESTRGAVASHVGEEGAAEIMNVIDSILSNPQPYPPVIAILDEELASAIPALPQGPPDQA
jgi:hypothetical protein